MVQTKRAEINSDTAVSIAHHHRPGARPQGGFLPSYDANNEGAWKGQTAFPGMPPPDDYPLPELDNTLLTPTKWVYSLKLPLRAHSLLLAIIQRIDWDTGKECWASVETLAEDARLSCREAARQIRWLAEHGIIGRKRRRDASAETWLIVDREGEQISLPNLDTERVRSATGGRSRSAKDGSSRSDPVGRLTNSSSTNSINQKVPGVVDAKRVDHVDHPGPEPGVTTGVKPSSLEEEGVTGSRLPGLGLRSRRPRRGLIATSRKHLYHSRLSRWASIVGRPGRSTGTWTLPARSWSGPKPRPAGASFAKTW